MRNRVIILFCFIFFSKNLFAQQLYMPRNIQKAYAKGSRSATGAPGKNYWQNKGVYDIQIELNPETAVISGFEKIAYSNNSPDTLKNLVISFVNNYHKPTSPRSSVVPEKFLTTGLKISSLKINGEVYNIDSRNWGTVKEIKLNSSILPKSTTNIEIEWSYPLSELSGREGRIDSTTFFAGYSYPRISVYDDYNGWDMMEHNGMQEFYNNFNDYKVAITVPKNFIVWATGDFLNPDEVLQPLIAQRLKESYRSDSVIHITTREEVANGRVTKQQQKNTWKFSYNHITDFTFAVSNHYIWDGGSVIVDKATGRRASMQSAYNHTATDFPKTVAWGKHTLEYYSTVMPGVPYPFPKMTAVQGYGNMEFPMMVNDVTVPHDLVDARMLQDHEVAHTYFPFYMGINETRYAYMDEGWAVFYTWFLSRHLFGEKTGDDILKNSRIKRWNTDAATEADIPLITMSSQLTGKAYRYNSYNKSAACYVALYKLLGEDTFKKAMQHYMNLWNGKHPIPWDFFNAINEATKMNLNWFWQNWFYANHYIDLQIQNVKSTQKSIAVDVVNVGGLYIPATITAYYSNGTTDTKEIKVDDWKNGSLVKKIIFSNKQNTQINKIEIDNWVFADATPEDNLWIKK